MQGKLGGYNWVTYGKDLVIYKDGVDGSFDSSRKGAISVTYSADKFLDIDKIQVVDFARAYDKQLSEVLTPVGVNLVNKVREDIVNKEIASMQPKVELNQYKVFVPDGVGVVAVENALRREGIEARVRK